MSFVSPNADKTQLRAQFRALRQSLDAAYASDAANRLAEHGKQALAALRQSRIAGYSAIHGEIDVCLLLARLHAAGHALCLPVVADGPERVLIFRDWKPGDALECGAYGVNAPPASAKEVTPDVLIVPLLAFDKRGHRLGYGAGYYDRTIQALRQANPELQVIGAAYAAQRAEALPAGVHDEALDAILTEKGRVAFA